MDKKSFDRGDIYNSDCLDMLRSLEENSIDSVVTDPPYGISFMGRKWDYDVPSEDIWRECLRVLKPGGHLLAFAGTRTQHRMAVRIEDAGFEIRDMIAWVYGSGFPKSMDVSKAIDKAGGESPREQSEMLRAKQWAGWGTALKPSLEPVTVARKPLTGTVAENVQAHGTGAMNVGGCRVGEEITITVRNGNSGNHGRYGKDARVFTRENPPGRWPANLIHDGSDEVLELFPESNGSGKSRTLNRGTRDEDSGWGMQDKAGELRDAGNWSAARFFYCAKASKSERSHSGKIDNRHPTVKPVDLMRYLVRLVTPKGGTVLDPFCGSGTTVVACHLEGMRFLACERDADSFETACERARLSIPVVSQFETDE